MKWKEVKLGDVITLIIDYRGKTPKKLGLDWTETGYRALSAKNIKTGHIVAEESIKYADEVLYRKWMKEEVKRGDILITSEAPFGQILHWDTDEKIVLSQRLFDIRLNDSVDSRFVYYYMTSNQFQKELDGRATGTTVTGLRQNELLKCIIRVPEDINDQRRIASILSSLDRKIEINNQINARLEEIVQALFKSWFIDFVPFKEGKFVDSEIGLIPERWHVGVLGELCTFQRGKNLLSKNAIDEGIPVVGGGLEPSCFHNKANTKAPVITISGSGANAGFMRMYHVPVWASDCSYIDISCSYFFFVYNYLKINNRLLTHAQTGAVQPHVKPSDIHKFTLVIPDDDSIRSFQNRVKCFYEKIGIIQQENRHLASLRDTLLPELMSGEFEIKA